MSINGWVRNLPDSRVEAVFSGDEKSLKKMIEICKKGPFLAEVRKIDVDWNYKTSAGIIGFNIIK